MNWLSVMVLAIVEGVSEYLPISSTGHMILASSLLKLTQTSFLSNFEIVIQVGAILAILTKYWKILITRRDYWPLIAGAFVPTMIIGYFGYKTVKNIFLGNVDITMMGLLLGGIVLILVERWKAKQNKKTISIEKLTVKQAVIIGLIQGISIVPGVSRSAATMIGGLLSGLNRKSAVEFSFLLGLPVLISACGYDLLKTGFNFSGTEWSQLIVGSVIAFVVAKLSVDWLIKFVEKHSLTYFGWYRIILAIIYFTSR